MSVPQYPVTSIHVQVDHAPPQQTAATFTLARPIAADNVLIEVNGDAPDGVYHRPTGQFMDGDQDLVPGGDFHSRFSVLPGDMTTNGIVNLLDLYHVRTRMGRSTLSPGTGGSRYHDAADVNADGRINVVDLAHVRHRRYTRLPRTQPDLPPAPAPAASPTQDLFSATPVLA